VRLQIQGLPGLGGFTAIQISPHGTNNAFGINIKDSSGLINVGDGADSDVFVDNVVNGAIVVGSGTCTDADGDGVPDTNDNCPTVANANQANFDGDSQGDACDPDDDNDGLLDVNEPGSGCLPSGGGRLDPDCDNDNISDGSLDPDGAGPILPGPDNCVTTPNTNQLNTDGDSMGNVCDTDDDNDTVLDGVDNCPINANASQTNSDSDAQGDACDLEDDGDGYLDTTETHVGTNSIDNCGAHTSTAPVFSQAWPGDVYSGTGIPATANKVTVQDLTSYLAPVRRINTNVGDLPLNVRWDLTPGKGLFAKDVNIQDLTSLVTVTPDMFGGARAFNGPTCTP
ncbi:MAG TPA: thrombospondin type 3 repeat-containing protein, partial [Dehalococcoidia bacterium]|nr:thrombospondin type 3 repeat-containing protein [Dehalococcoidia bacterium]